MVVCHSQTKKRLPITMTVGGSTYVSFHTDGCRGTANEVNSLEQVQVFVDIDHESRGKLEIYLKSPSGTVSMLLSPRPNDKSKNGFANWHFTSVHFWGEEPQGRWNLLIREKGENKTHKAAINEATLLLYGSREIPSHLKKKKVYHDEKLVSACLDRFEVRIDLSIFDHSFLLSLSFSEGIRGRTNLKFQLFHLCGSRPVS